MKKILMLVAHVMFVSLLSNGQTFFSGELTGQVIKSSNNIKMHIETKGLPEKTGSVFSLKSVCVHFKENASGAYTITLTSPDKQVITLASNQEVSGKTCFTENWDIPDKYFVLPDMELQSISGFASLNHGTTTNGTWSLSVTDNEGNIESKIKNWEIGFDYNIKKSFASSNLPIFHIKANGQYISASQKRMVDFGVVYNGHGQINQVNGPWNHYNGKATIKIRGESSQMFPKKAYSLVTVDGAGADFNFPLLGLPTEHKWVLHASYNDKSLMRNQLAYRLFEEMGNYSVRTKYVELFIDNDYRGVYLLVESIKRDKSRVAIAKLNPEDSGGNELTGGYIVRIDKPSDSKDGWVSNHASNMNGDRVEFQYEYPRPANITTFHKEYIRDWFHSFENALKGSNFTDIQSGYRKYIDVRSFVDNFIINELSKDLDGYRVSSYFYKDRDDRYDRLVNGPVWDFDLAWFNADYGGGNTHIGWQYKYGWDYQGGSSDPIFPVPFWWRRMMEDPRFVEDIFCRYELLRMNGNALDQKKIFALIDSTVNLLKDAQVRNFERWPVLGIYLWPNPEPHPATYQGEVDKLKDWVVRRMKWIDDNLPGFCTTTSVSEYAEQKILSVFPNPVLDEINIDFELGQYSEVSIRILNSLGSVVEAIDLGRQTAGRHSKLVSTKKFPAGIYFLQVEINEQKHYHKLVKVAR